MTEKKNSWQEWWDSDACKNLQKAHKEGVERAVGKYFMLSEEDKLDMIQAICTIICKAESEGTSHRGLQDALGVYPAGFWVSELMDVHNALWSYYHDQKKEKEFKDDLDTLDKFLDKKEEQEFDEDFKTLQDFYKVLQHDPKENIKFLDNNILEC